MIDRVQTYLGAGSSPNRNPLFVREQSKEIIGSSLESPIDNDRSCINRLGFLLRRLRRGFKCRGRSRRWCRRCRPRCISTTRCRTDSQVLPMRLENGSRELGKHVFEDFRKVRFGDLKQFVDFWGWRGREGPKELMIGVG